MTAMSKVACILLAAWCAIAELPSKKQREEILECHTKQREEVEPAASDMQLMVYSKELEQLAEEFAATCKLPVTYPQRHPKYGRIGYVVVVEHTHKPNYTDVFCKYSGGYYDYDKGKCKGICYQYKQIVRAKTAAVGCTIHHCNYQLEDPKQGYVLACLYSPSKQVIREKPYSKGPSCSQCPRGSKCFRKQCYHDSAIRDARIVPPPSLIAALTDKTNSSEADSPLPSTSASTMLSTFETVTLLVLVVLSSL